MGSGRLPEGGGNATMKQRSVFEGPRGAGAAVREVKLMGSGVQIQQLQVAQAAQAGHHGTPVQPHARVTATAQPMMAQAAAPAPAAAPPASEAEIERIIERQLPPQGLTKKEAQQLADALSVAIDAAQKATASGVRCFGVDDASIADALKTRDYLANFAYNAGASDRTDPAKLTPDKLNTVERILECQMTQGSGSNTAALVVGGVILGAVGLYLVLNEIGRAHV